MKHIAVFGIYEFFCMQLQSHSVSHQQYLETEMNSTLSFSLQQSMSFHIEFVPTYSKAVLVYTLCSEKNSMCDVSLTLSFITHLRLLAE